MSAPDSRSASECVSLAMVGILILPRKRFLRTAAGQAALLTFNAMVLAALPNRVHTPASANVNFVVTTL